MLIYVNNHCICGSRSHSRINNHKCPINPKNSKTQSSSPIGNNTIIKNINMNKLCKCGSGSHKRITHSLCALNIFNTHVNSQPEEQNTEVVIQTELRSEESTNGPLPYKYLKII